VQTPRRWGEPLRAGVLPFVGLDFLPLRTSCWIVGTKYLGTERPVGRKWTWSYWHGSRGRAGQRPMGNATSRETQRQPLAYHRKQIDLFSPSWHVPLNTNDHQRVTRWTNAFIISSRSDRLAPTPTTTTEPSGSTPQIWSFDDMTEPAIGPQLALSDSFRAAARKPSTKVMLPITGSVTPTNRMAPIGRSPRTRPTAVTSLTAAAISMSSKMNLCSWCFALGERAIGRRSDGHCIVSRSCDALSACPSSAETAVVTVGGGPTVVPVQPFAPMQSTKMALIAPCRMSRSYPASPSLTTSPPSSVPMVASHSAGSKSSSEVKNSIGS